MVNFAALALQRARNSISRERLDEIHQPLQAAFRSTEQYLRQIPEDDEYADAAIDSGVEYLEDLLGIAVVAAQAQITSIRTAIVTVSQVSIRAGGVALPFLGDPKGHGTLRILNQLNQRTQLTRIEAINAMANYWKHKEEWPTIPVTTTSGITLEWDRASARNVQSTIEAVTALGMSYERTRNLQEALRSLGITDPANLEPVRTWIGDWAEALLQETAKYI